MSIALFIANGIGSRAKRKRRLPQLWKKAAKAARISRPLRLQVAGEKPGEGNPADPGQARMQVSIHAQSGGASVGPKGYVPAYLLLRTSPDPVTSWSVEGTPGMLKGEGRRERTCLGLFSESRYS